MYDTLLSHLAPEKQAPRGENVYFFLREGGCTKPEPAVAHYGVGVQDFRVTNLSRHIKNEKERQVEMQAELDELFQTPYADGKHPVLIEGNLRGG